jgi:hypothetical protein
MRQEASWMCWPEHFALRQYIRSYLATASWGRHPTYTREATRERVTPVLLHVGLFQKKRKYKVGRGFAHFWRRNRRTLTLIWNTLVSYHNFLQLTQTKRLRYSVPLLILSHPLTISCREIESYVTVRFQPKISRKWVATISFKNKLQNCDLCCYSTKRLTAFRQACVLVMYVNVFREATASTAICICVVTDLEPQLDWSIRQICDATSR